jgi:PEP-CTERM motif
MVLFAALGRCNMRFRLAAALTSVLLLTPPASADSILYGGNGGHSNSDGTPLSIHNGWLVTIDQATGNVDPVGHPDDVARLSGIAFASNDILYATTLGGGGFPDNPPPPNPSRLIRIDPNTGALVSDIGLITAGAGGPGISIGDLSIQPGTGVLYGIESREAAGGLGPPFGNLYMINSSTGVATLIGSTGLENASLAFAPDGTLYATSGAVNPDDPFGPLIEVQIATLDPATGKVLTRIPTSTFYTALTFDQSTGLLIGGNGSGDSLVSGDIFSIDPATGNQIAHLSETGLDFVGDLDFRPVPEPSSLTLVGMGLVTALSGRHLLIRHKKAVL